ncbi:site-2 protease family protein [Streptomyces sp. NPDC002888]|uniref:site-2 protease family protein n=1 Tax=Streptomyces sp. NPDC002888 TaxID=3364668 RepID=UPI0036C7B811
MVESGGSGQPRPGNDEAAEQQAGPTARAADPTRPDPAPHDDTTPSESNGADPHGSTTPDAVNGPAEGAAAQPEGTAADATESPGEAAEEHSYGAAPTPDATEHRTPSASTAPDEPEDPAHEKNTPAEPSETEAVPGATAGQPGSPAGHHADTHPGHPHAHSGSKRRPPRPPESTRGGLLMGRPFGVPVYVAPSWFLVAILITWVFGGQLDRVLPELGALRYLVSLFFAIAFYASVLVHELAHTVAALRFKLPVRRIQLQFFGGVSEIEKEAETPGREFVLAFVGPLLSLVLSGLFYLAMQPVEPGTVPGVLLAGLMISNLIVAAFNLLPGLPLDGGRMLRAVVWKITGKPMAGTIAAAWVGRALAVSVLIGLPLLTQSGALGSAAEDSVGMDTVMDALLAAILAAIIWTGAGNSLRMARLREHLPDLRARTLTRRAVPVETDTPLSEALRRANDAGARALVVVDAHGEPVSLVREAAIVGVPEHRRPWVPVSSLAHDLTDGMRVSAELSGEDLLDALRATPATEYLVVEETGEIYGVLSAADVERAFVKAMARPS